MLGHELRNPLSPIVTALQVLRLKGQISPEHEIIERQIAHQIRLVDDLLDVSRITQGKIELRRERVEIAEVAQRAIEMASPLLEQKRQVLRVDIPHTGLFVDADAARLAQVLANLLTNAAKYSDAGTEVVFSAEWRDGRVIISVKDQGIGVEPEMLDHIFDRFVQQRQGADRAQGGLGLGLAIVRSLVQLHGGTVDVHSEGVGHGSEFVIELPAAARDTPVDLLLASADEEPIARPTESARVLVVDDNADGAELLADALALLGYEVRTAGDGPTALRMASQFHPSIGLLDIGLPVMDGYELGLRLRQIPELASLRLVAITGYGQDTDRQRSRDAGFDAHLVKPIDLSMLQQILNGLAAGDAGRV
jgi:CheY-like chemotaxis protein